jgi:hypothetical protein
MNIINRHNEIPRTQRRAVPGKLKKKKQQQQLPLYSDNLNLLWGADHKNRLKTCRVSTRAQRVIFITFYIYILSGWSYAAAGSREEKKHTHTHTSERDGRGIRKNPINLIALRRGKQSHIFPFFSSCLPGAIIRIHKHTCTLHTVLFVLFKRSFVCLFL